MIQQCMTTEQFLQIRPDLPEAGQWAELVDGFPSLLEPPDLDHGTVVLNLSKKLAEYFSAESTGYACFDLGLQLGTAPDTVLFPAVSVYLEGPRFEHSDDEYSPAPPQLVIEILSTPDRRQQAVSRAGRFMTWGVPVVWQINGQLHSVALWHRGTEPQKLSSTDILADPEVLKGFSMPVRDLFAEPDWYRGTR